MISASDLIGLGCFVDFADDGAPIGSLKLPPAHGSGRSIDTDPLVVSFRVTDNGAWARVMVVSGLDASGRFYNWAVLDSCRPETVDDIRAILRALTTNNPVVQIPPEPAGKLRLLQESIEFVRIVTGPPRGEPDLRGDGVQYRCPLCQAVADHPNAVPHQMLCVHHPSIPRLNDWSTPRD